MFQSFDVKGGPRYGRENLPRLREELRRRGLDGFFVPHEDEYQNEYLPAATDRLAWVTGFTGSSGAALVLGDKAIVFTDGRYTIQVKEQADPALFDYAEISDHGVAKWIEEYAPQGAVIGYDPKLISPDAQAVIEKAAGLAGVTMKALDDNPIDAIWEDRPSMPDAAVSVQPLELAGEAHGDKRARLGKAIKKAGADAVVITFPPSVAWTLNIRGGDVAHAPLPLSQAILNADGTTELFIARDKLTDEVRSHLGNEVSVREEGELGEAIAGLKGKKVLVDPASASAWHFATLEGAGAMVVRGEDPAALPRAVKNEAELKGARNAHVRDGVAVTRFLHWFTREAPKGELDEISTVVKLEEIRRENDENLKDLSFDSISGYGEHGALPHYRVNEASVLPIQKGSLYLVDSGGQYPDGTTDITRTLAVGEPTAEMKERYTQVLKGHIALSVIRFPEGTSGMALDALARAPLWMAGVDYDHGTGHGVGAYLGVHEGPQRIAKGSSPTPLKPGMIVSNEPGYYKAGEYGIRIENLQYVTEPEIIEGGDAHRQMMGFETITLAPLDRNLIQPGLLSDAEREWVNAYHARVLYEIGPRLDEDVRNWLKDQCAPI